MRADVDPDRPVDPPDPVALLTPREVAALFSVTPKTIARWNDAGLLASVRTRGGHRRYPADAVHELREFLQGVGVP